MAGITSFDVRYILTGAEQFPEMASRARDLRPAFDVIVRKWARGNVDKFDKSRGREESGAQIYDVFWDALTSAYMKRKRKLGQANQIMVATGALREAITNLGGFFSETTPGEVAFGTPTSIEEEVKVRYNWDKRQVIFLSTDDRLMIEETVQSYLGLGPQFESIRFSQGLQNVRDRNDVARMDVEFGHEMES